MGGSPEPVVLELAMLPREQVGPFLLLGLDKAADKAEIDAHWANRLKWARKGQAKIALEDINWAREVLHDTERRIRADAASLNADTSDGNGAKAESGAPAAPPGEGFDPEAFLIRPQLGPDARDLYAETHRELDRLLLPRVLDYTGGNQQRAALLLGIARQTLRAKLQDLGLRVARSVEANDDDQP